MQKHSRWYLPFTEHLKMKMIGTNLSRKVLNFSISRASISQLSLLTRLQNKLYVRGGVAMINDEPSVFMIVTIP